MFFTDGAVSRRSIAVASQLLLLTILPAAVAQAEASATKAQVYGHVQGTAEDYDHGRDDGLGFDRVRIGGRYAQGRLNSHVQIDFNAEPTRRRRTGTVLNAVQLAYIGWQANPSARIRVGQFKTPLGMDFNLPGAGLDITKRGLDAPLTLNRAIGASVGSRNVIAGFGYDVGVFGPAGRSGAVFGVNGDPFDQEGEDFTVVGRLHYDAIQHLHLEAAVGQAEHAGGADASRDYTVVDVGARYRRGPWHLAAEYIEGSDIRGQRSRDQSSGYLHAGWQVARRVELVARHYRSDADTPTGDSRLRNTFYGVNLFLGPEADRHNMRLQLNYLDAGGDLSRWTGIGGFTSNAVLAQFQLIGSHDLLN